MNIDTKAVKLKHLMDRIDDCHTLDEYKTLEGEIKKVLNSYATETRQIPNV